MNGKRVNKIRQIVRLQQFVKKWRTLAISRDTSHPKSKQSSPFSYDSDEDCCRSPASSPPPDVPEGYLAVYVGGERRRFIIPTTYLSRPVFRTLLQKAEEEFGFDHKGGLTIPCEVSIFKHVLRMLERNDPAGQKLSLDEVMIFCSLEREYGSEAYSKI